MARGRMLNQTVATDKRLNSISENAELAFLKTIPHLDRDGLIIGDPALLAAKVCPRRPQLSSQMESIILEWQTAGLVIIYTPGEDQVLFFPGFTKNQVGLRYDREPESIYPPPPGYHRNGNGLEENTDTLPDSGNNPSDSGNPPAIFRQSSGKQTDECLPNIREENRKENNYTTARETIRSEIENGSSGGSEQPIDSPITPSFQESQPVIQEAKPPQSAPAAQQQSDYAQVCQAFEDNGFGMLSVILSEQIADMLEEYPLSWILSAMRISVGANKRQLRYVNGILKKWRADGVDPTVQTADKPKSANAPTQIQADETATAFLAQLFQNGGQHAASQRRH